MDPREELIDLDWSFGVTTTSDELSKIGKVFVQLRLTLGTREHHRDEFVEMSVDQFFSWMGQLERCAAQIGSVK